MATFVKLTRPDGKATYVCPDQVCEVNYSADRYLEHKPLTEIAFVNGRIQIVNEDLPIVIAMLRYPNNGREA